MKTRMAWALGSGAAAAAAVALAAVAGGCADSSSTDNGNGSGAAAGTGGTSPTTSSVTGGGGGTGGSGGGGACGAAELPAVTVEQIARGDEVGPGVEVRLENVVAMSHLFLVSKSSTTYSCLWGVFLSAPGLSETDEYQGILALSYGDDASVPEGGSTAYCPVLGLEPTGNAIPDGVKPGDVLTLVGETDYFVLDQCESEPNGASAPQRQLSKVECAIITGEATPPEPAVISLADIPKLGDPDDTDFHDRWGGVKVRVEDVSADAIGAGGGGGGTVVGDYGIITLNQGGVEVGNKIYYRGYLKYSNYCHNGPVFDTDSTYEWSYIQGFNVLNYCTWGLQPNEKCGDFDPSSEDCVDDYCEPTMP